MVKLHLYYPQHSLILVGTSKGSKFEILDQKKLKTKKELFYYHPILTGIYTEPQLLLPIFMTEIHTLLHQNLISDLSHTYLSFSNSLTYQLCYDRDLFFF